MDIWVFYTFWLLCIVLLRTFMNNYLLHNLKTYFGYISNIEITGLYGNILFNLLKNFQVAFHSGCTILCSHQQCTSVPVSPHSCKHLFFFLFFLSYCHLRKCKVIFHCGFYLQFTNISWCWASCYVFGDHLSIFIEESSIQKTIELFLIEMIIFLLLICKTLIYYGY